MRILPPAPLRKGGKKTGEPPPCFPPDEVGARGVLRESTSSVCKPIVMRSNLTNGSVGSRVRAKARAVAAGNRVHGFVSLSAD
jgi:hypothetical protein